SVFRTEEEPLLRPLPAVPYEIATWVYSRKVAKNSHVVWQKNSYSVPYVNIGKTVDLRITTSMVEIYDGHDRLTSHVRVPARTSGVYRTHDGDLPEGKGYQPWDEHRVRDWATRIGPNALTVVDQIFAAVPVTEQGLDPALAVLRLSRRFTTGRVEAACKIALEANIRSPRYSHVRPILDTGQDKTGNAVPSSSEGGGYVRGASYYAGGQSK
ncbi:MAG: Mu transposase domain-containing protein, partial [Flaviflexus sp.]